MYTQCQILTILIINHYHVKGSETSETMTVIQYTNLFGIIRPSNSKDKENDQSS